MIVWRCLPNPRLAGELRHITPPGARLGFHSEFWRIAGPAPRWNGRADLRPGDVIKNGGIQLAVLRAGRDWDVLAVNDLGEGAFATPALLAGRIYVRTDEALYCFALKP